jgi:hypothetical protein
MSGNVNIALVTLANTFNDWRIGTNNLANSVNNLRNSNYVKDNGNFVLANGAIQVTATVGTGLAITNNVLFSQLTQMNTYITTGDASMGHNVFVTNANSTMNVAGNLFVGTNALIVGNTVIDGSLTVVGNTVLGNLTVNGTTTSLGNSVSSTDTIILRNNLGSSGNAHLIIEQGGTNGNADFRFLQTSNVWQLTPNTQNGYSTILVAANIADSVSNSSIISVASANSVEWAYQTAIAAYAVANIGGAGSVVATNAYGQANNAYGQANNAYGRANLVYGQANAAYGAANTGIVIAENAYAKANSITGTPTGSNTDVQFNDSGAFGGTAGLTFNKATGLFTVGGSGVFNGSTYVQVNSAAFSTGSNTVAGIIINNQSANGQSVLEFQNPNSSVPNLGVGRIRYDYVGNMSYSTANNGSHYFFVDGDSGIGTQAMAIRSSQVLMAGQLAINNSIVRQSNTSGWLDGNFSTAENGSTAGCIYSIGGGVYVPGASINPLGTIYGIGFTTSSTVQGATGSTTIATRTGAPGSSWGMYVAIDGGTPIFLSGTDGGGYFTGPVVAANFNGSGSGLTGTASALTAGAANSLNMANDTSGAPHDLVVAVTTVSAQYSAGATLTSAGALVVGSINATSDRDLKTNIQTITNPADIIASLNGVRFVWKKDGTSSAGLIAQDVEVNMPELVATNDKSIKSVNYNGIVAVLVEEVKALRAEVELLKAK